jgi:hypothetical protein
MSKYPDSFPACRLYRKTSANGNVYFTGRWGGARVTLLKSRETADDGGEIWNLMLSEAPAKAGGVQHPKAEKGSSVRSPHYSSPPH